MRRTALAILAERLAALFPILNIVLLFRLAFTDRPVLRGAAGNRSRTRL